MRRDSRNDWRTDLKPIEVVQPQGPSFTVRGNEVSWCGWRLRVGFTPREGLVLHDIAIRDNGRWRPVIRRAALAEMVVPYGSPHGNHPRKNAFDCGEYGIGMLANSLSLGCDCLGVIHYFDAVVNSIDGSPRVIPNAICLHEEDAGVLWKHYDFRTNETDTRRSRRLVISFIATVGQLRVRLLLVSFPGWNDPARGQAHRDHLHGGNPDRGGARLWHRGRTRRVWARSISTCSTFGSTWR